MVNHKKIFIEGFITGLICILANYYVKLILDLEKKEHQEYLRNAIYAGLIIFISVVLKSYVFEILLI